MSLRIGVVGYSDQKFDVATACRAIDDLFNIVSKGHDDVVMVSALNDLGIPGIAHRIARARGWRTVGVSCSKAYEYALLPVDESIIVGSEWGDESETFLRQCNVLIRVGGGKQSLVEVAQFKLRGGTVYEFELPALVG